MKFLLLDASIIIEAHRLKIWQMLISYYKISVVSSVASESSFFSNNLSQRKNYIDLGSEFKAKKLTKISIPHYRVEEIIKKAIFPAYLNGVADRLVSFEKCLINAGIRKNLNYQYTEEALNRWRAEAIQRFNPGFFKE